MVRSWPCACQSAAWSRASGVPVDQHPDHQLRVIRWGTAPFGVPGQDPGQVQVLIDQLGHEPGQVLGRQPFIQRGRQQKALIRSERPKRLVNRALRPDRNARSLHPRLDLEQTLVTMIAWHDS